MGRRYTLHLGSRSSSESSSAGSGGVSATPRQLARLRYLGVPFKEPLSVGRAGVLIDQTESDPALAARIEQWHREKYLLHPDLYPPTPPEGADWFPSSPATAPPPPPIPSSSWPAIVPSPPPIPGPSIPPASPVIGMGASAHAQGRSSRGRTLGILTLGIVLGLGITGTLTLWLWRHQHPVAHEVFAAKQLPSPPRPSVLPPSTPVTVVPTPTPTPTLAVLPRPPATTPAPAKTAAESYQRARAKHPALDFPDTPFCKQFAAEMRRLKSRRDPLLENPSHPEIVADKLGRQLVGH